MSAPVISLDHATVGYQGHAVLRDISLVAEPGEFVGVLGPNGAGKTTLLNILNGIMAPTSGTVSILGRQVDEYRPRELARLVATVPQKTTVGFDFTVWQLVLMGRYPYAEFLGGETPQDREIAREMLKQTGTAHLADRSFNTLSGGEQQRVVLTRALVQQPQLLLLDEPTAHLDIAYQVELLNLLRGINEQQGLTIVLVVHDLNLANLYCNRLVFLDEGKVFADGAPEEVMRPELIEKVYGSTVEVFTHPDTNRPQVLLRSTP